MTTEVVMYALLIMNVVLLCVLTFFVIALKDLNFAIAGLLLVAQRQDELWKSQTIFNRTAKSVIADLQQEVTRQTM